MNSSLNPSTLEEKFEKNIEETIEINPSDLNNNFTTPQTEIINDYKSQKQ